MDGKRNNKKRVALRLGHISIMVLKIIATSGLVAAVMVAPGVAVAMKMIPKDESYKKKIWNIENRVLRRLHQRGLIYVTEKEGKRYFGLTARGEEELERRGIEIISKKNKKWDKKWRVVIFDIPEEKKMVREKLRRYLKNKGYIKIQGSVWVNAHSSKDFVMLLRARFGLTKEVLVMEVNNIENDEWLKKHFGVK